MKKSLNFIILFLVALAICNLTHAITVIKSEFIDCSGEEDTSDGKNQIFFDCKTINQELSNCTCVKDDYIDCSNKNFFSIPSNLTKMPDSITRLFFSKNQISSLDKITLSPTAAITAIDLRKNKISTINSDNFFSDQLSKSLDYLNMCGNLNMNDFNKIRVEFPKLSWLELNHIVESYKIQDKFFSHEKFPSLTFLSLNDVSLKFDKTPFNRYDLILIISSFLIKY
jgi:hypothetical protein